MTDRQRNAFILILVFGLLAASAVGIALKKTQLGLDLQGGVQLSYQGLPTAQTPVVTQDALSRAVDIMRTRVDQLGVSEPQIQTSQGLGSGVVFDADGDIVTNNHVIGSDTGSFTVTAGARSYGASLVGRFGPDDLAVVHVSDAQLTPAAFADSSALEVGDVAIAIGNPLGLRSSVTEGIVSAFRQGVSEGNGVALPLMV